MEIGMHLQAGLGKISVLVFLLIVTGIFLTFVSYSGTYKETCIGNNLALTNVTPTIQTIAYFSNEPKGKHRLIRGRIEFLIVEDNFIAGYLSTRFFKEDELLGLEGENDKEGFFIVNKSDRNVESGLNGNTFFQSLEDKYQKKLVDFIKPNQVQKFGECNLGN